MSSHRFSRPRGFLAVFTVIAALAACSDHADAPSAAAPRDARFIAAPAGRGIPGQYIVVLRDDADRTRPADDDAQSVAAAYGVTPRHTYSAVLRGFAAGLTPRAVAELLRDPRVAYVEQDQVVTTAATQAPATWGLDRIDQRAGKLSNSYTYATVAAGVNAYVIDTGIQTAHRDFGGRAVAAFDAFGGNGQDCNGHGTHVAGTIGGATFGVAKGAGLFGVRVLNCEGSGSTSRIIAGIEWVRLNHVKPAVANLSLGGLYSASENRAVTALVNAGVFVAVAAGNSADDACAWSPASAAGVMTVAASNSSDQRASFSNWGPCVEIYAPGVKVHSDWPDNRTAILGGTSMAAPHVAGVAALYKATYGDAPSAVINDWIIRNSTQGAIKGNVTGTPNRLLYTVTAVPRDHMRAFDAAFYLRHYPDLRAAFGNNLAAARRHWLTQGLPIEGRRGSAGFDVRFYLSHHADLKRAFGSNYGAALDHWLDKGLPTEGRRGSRELDVRFYLAHYADVRRVFGTDYGAAADHWAVSGVPVDGRRGSREFDTRYYLAAYPDLRAAFGTNYHATMHHWIHQGLPIEGRRGSVSFSVQYYLATYPDLRQAFGRNYVAAFDHWIVSGIREGRRGAP